MRMRMLPYPTPRIFRSHSDVLANRVPSGPGWTRESCIHYQTLLRGLVTVTWCVIVLDTTPFPHFHPRPDGTRFAQDSFGMPAETP